MRFHAVRHDQSEEFCIRSAHRPTTNAVAIVSIALSHIARPATNPATPTARKPTGMRSTIPGEHTRAMSTAATRAHIRPACFARMDVLARFAPISRTRDFKFASIENTSAMVEYSLIGEAWGTSTPPVRYRADALFDVGKNPNYSGLDENLCDSHQALESAYPPDASVNGGATDRFAFSRTNSTLPAHKPRSDDACPPGGDLMDRLPARSYSRESPVEGSGVPGGQLVDGRSSAPSMTPSYPSARPIADKTDAAERGTLYDILVFLLFGLLLVLAMHEIASLGEFVGRSRAQASRALAQASRAAAKHAVRPHAWA